MYALLYRSRARPGLMAGDLNAIIATAGRRNPDLGLTGLLLYGHLPAIPGAAGEFLQWVEGPEAAVEALFDEIGEDGRHYDVEVLARGEGLGHGSEAAGADGRLFGAWAMGLVRLSRLPATLPGFLDFARTWDRQALPAAE